MAAQTCTNVQTATLSTTVADSVTFAGIGEDFAVTNHDASALLFFRIGGTTAVGSADENFVVLPGSTMVVRSRDKKVLSIVGNGNVYTAALY